MRAARIALRCSACLLAAGALVAGCGGGSGSDRLDLAPTASAKSRPAPPKSDFPSARRADPARGDRSRPTRPPNWSIAPAALVFYQGENRYPFGVFERDRHPGPRRRSGALLRQGRRRRSAGAKSEAGEQGRGARRPRRRRSTSRPIGPFPAAIESLATEARLPRRDDRRRPRRGQRRLLDPASTSPATASGGSRR